MSGLEKKLYPLVERWAKRHFRCFRMSINRGPRDGRIDVVGARDTGGDLTGEVELIGIEVKRGTSAFANMCGQTVGYGVYANRVYLADKRDKPFSYDQMQIAGHLGIGLIWIKGVSCHEVLTSQYHRPMAKMQALLLDKMQLGKCQWCESVFELSRQGTKPWSSVVRQGGYLNKVRRAFEDEKGLMFWSNEVAKRKRRLRIRPTKEKDSFERRYICPDCIVNVAADLLHHKTADRK